MNIKGVIDKMNKFLNNPIARIVSMFVVIVMTILLTSAATNKTATEQISDFARYQFKTSIREVLNEEVMPALQENSEAIKRLDTMVDMQMQSIYDETVRQIEKTYEKYQKGDRDFTKVNFDAMAKTWKALPEERKTDSLCVKYKTLMAYYPNLK